MVSIVAVAVIKTKYFP